jgi:6-pyruvoyltetrahydropterin/6-carboxytetrahydropterin synthase
MGERFWVRVTKDYLVFSAAHFITFNGTVCERLHGHNYRVLVELAGPLDENAYVFDFVALRESLRELVLEWDHHVLLPADHPAIHVTVDDREVTARFEDRRWVFPREDAIVLPVTNTTAELLARHLGRELLRRLAPRGFNPAALRVHVDECEGQWAVWDWTPDA